MKFKEWLFKIEEDNQQRQTPGDRSSAPPAARFGSALTQLPFSKGLDNTAVASLAGGVGHRMQTNFDKAGLRLSTSPRIETFPHGGKPYVSHMSLPLQLPIVDNAPELAANFRYGKSSIKTLQNLIPNPLSDHRIRKLGENKQEPGKFELYHQTRDFNDTQRSLYAATEFTQALMHYILMTQMMNSKDAAKYDLANIKLESSRRDDQHNVLTCVFSIRQNRLFQKDDNNTGEDK